MEAHELFTLPPDFPFAAHFPPGVPPWEWVRRVAPALQGFDFATPGARAEFPAGVAVSGAVWIHASVRLPPYAVLQGPAWIGPGTEIRPGAYVRGNVIVGPGCVLGNACEYKNCLLLEGVQTPHYNYVGDTILGRKAHLGAGVICANLRLDQKSVPVTTPAGRVDSGLRKLGALVGDEAEAGCNAVLQPGAILGRRAAVLPTIAFAGYLAPGQIAAERLNLRLIGRPE